MSSIILKSKLSDEAFSKLFTILCIATILGFFISRALVSIGSILMPILLIYQFGLKQTIHTFLNFKWNWFATLILFASMLSVLWSNDIVAWQKDTATKLSLLVLPLGFAVSKIDKLLFFKWINCALNSAILITIVRSLYIYAIDLNIGSINYMLDTTLYNDHIRFSFVISLVILCNLFLLFEWKKILSKRYTYFISFVSIIGFIYLHLLSARTGLLTAYTVIAIFFIIKSWKYRKILTLAVVICLGTMPLIAMQFSPRLKEKITFMIHEATTVKNLDESVQYNYTDNNRILSYKAAWNSIISYPLIGVGSGDLRNEMRAQYKELFPGVPENGSLEVPHMQILSTSMALGLPIGIIGILGLLFTPLIQLKKWKLYVLINSILMFIFLSIDANLEIQFGLLIIIFFNQFWRIIADESIITSNKKSE